MPFQVVYSEYSRQPGIINSFDAGADQIAVCDLEITLTATVDGDLFGHTILWEQISGAPITFITPTDQLTVTYVNAIPGSPITGGVFDDKVFRFTIDKGSTDPNNPEQFDEVNVFGAPTNPVFTSYVSVIGGQGAQGQNYLDTDVPQNFTFILDNDGGGCGNTQFDLIWSGPATNESRVVRYEVEEYTPGAGFSTVAVFNPQQRRFKNVQLGRSYRVITYLVYGGVHVGELLAPDPTSPAAQSTSYQSYAAAPVTVDNFDVLIRSIVICDEPELDDNNIYGSYAAAPVTIDNFDVITRTVVTCTEPELDDNNIYGSYAAGSVVIEDFNVVDLDGSQVGG